jgi:hypothetical protein
VLAGKPAMQNCSNSGKPVQWQSRAKPEAKLREAVETRRAAPTPPQCSGHGEGIVQTPNLDEGVPGRSSERAAKAVEARKSAGRKAVWVRLPPTAPPFFDPPCAGDSAGSIFHILQSATTTKIRKKNNPRQQQKTTTTQTSHRPEKTSPGHVCWVRAGADDPLWSDGAEDTDESDSGIGSSRSLQKRRRIECCFCSYSLVWPPEWLGIRRDRRSIYDYSGDPRGWGFRRLIDF